MNINKGKSDLEHPWNKSRIFYISIIVAIAYYLSARFGLLLSFKPDYISALWPPNAILLSALLLTKSKHWIWFLLAIIPAELAADLPSGISLPMSIGFVLSDWIEVLTGAILFRKFSSKPPDFVSIKQLSLYILCCVIIAPFVAAFIGAVVTGLDQAGPNYITRWSRWLSSDALTHLLFTPFIVLWLQHNFQKSNQRSASFYYEIIMLSGMLIIVGFGALSGIILKVESFPALLYTPLPILLWAAVRFGPRGIFSSSLFISIICIWSASNGSGPFATSSASENVINLQIYFLLILTPLLFLATLMEAQKRTEKQLKNSEKQFRTLVETSPVGIAILRQNQYLYVNSSWENLTGYSKEEAKTLTPLMTIHPDVREQIGKNVENRLNYEPVDTRYEIKGISKTGEVIWYDSSVTLIEYLDKPAILSFITNITEQNKYLEVLKNQATTDALTGIYNRMKFNKSLTIEIKRVERYNPSLSLVIFDIDHFKQVNDTYGHLAGDNVLKRLSKLVFTNIREIDIFARWGGEEFVVLIPGAPLDDAIKVAEKLRSKIETYNFLEPEKITASFGVATFQSGDNNFTLVNRADEALLCAKESGRNQVVGS